MSPHAHRTRRRAMVAASGLAALALTLSACSGDDTADDTVADATSAVASAATEATSAVGSAAAEATSAVGEAGDGDDHEGHDHGDHDGDDHPDKDREYLDALRDNGVTVHDDVDFLVRGHDACRDLEDGESADVVIASYYEAHPEAPENEGATVLEAAVNAFCPDYAPALNN
ncbi:DUF732 domain-containing protein [Dietzia sp. NPDC055340]